MYIDDSFIDKYIGYVTPLYMTIYMYLRRRSASRLSAKKVCDDMGISSNSLRRSINFWYQQGEIEYLKWEDGSDEIIFRFTTKKTKELPLTDAQNLLNTDEEFKQIIGLFQSTFQTVSAKDKMTIASLYSGNHFNKDTFVVLLKYAVDHGAKYPAYAFKIASKWVDAGIQTYLGALCWIDNLWAKFCSWNSWYGDYNCNVSPLTDADIKMFRTWNELYDDDMVKKAIDITMLNKMKKNLPYTNGVLKNMAKDSSST